MKFPEATISNGQITAKIHLPDPRRGFYRSTRFDWSGMIASLEFTTDPGKTTTWKYVYTYYTNSK
jgi:hypothetical protein